jgi:catechol 2,3-dioxygenase
MEHALLPPDTRLGTVHLRVANLAAMVSFYEEAMGFSVLAEDGGSAALAARPGRPLLVLHAAASAAPAPRGSTGLFHVAFLLPSRAALGGMIHRLRAHGWPLLGYADHNVSEAVYLSDPEGNGIELYADRSTEVWRTIDGEIFITTEPLDVDGLLAAASAPARALPPESVVGHVHLRVSTLETAEAFYLDRLGFQAKSRRMPGALFAAAGGYHHHLGLNVWEGEGRPRPEGSRGLISFEVLVSDDGARRRILDGADEGLLLDPDDIGVRIARG